MRILVVEDDPVLSDGLRTGLGMFGATLDVVESCADGRAALASSEFDALVLDLMLPDGSGLDLLADLRAAGDRTPVLLLTALDEIADRVKGLDAGADDYLGKPFDLDELGARLRAIARRQNGRASPLLSCNGIVLDPATMSAAANGERVSLSRREFAVLQALMERPGVLRSKDALEASLYGWQEEIESNTVEVHIHKLRAKLGRHAIETVRGIGYRIRVGA
ncbi:transcriptional regulator [Bradyrhizobium sp. CCBAU 11434]|uniref:Response regulator transcription factor n=1 Tax=Bradyrhizobium zhengyangense TaxID=2911009 RepID=A0ABS9LM37_9BRAD|nr:MULTISPECIES: response regulator transcription factor [Bradyrhizobium]MCG2668065.1 response regulator transcription factor [Bradyrhizobium zhengyangense]MDA9525640.1 transcriptional regulator [Bradyrhizobium sp. CCBAU 11434]